MKTTRFFFTALFLLGIGCGDDSPGPTLDAGPLDAAPDSPTLDSGEVDSGPPPMCPEEMIEVADLNALLAQIPATWGHVRAASQRFTTVELIAMSDIELAPADIPALAELEGGYSCLM